MVKKADRQRIWLIKRPRGLIAAYGMDQDYLDRYPIDTRLICTLEQPRDPGTMRALHALIQYVAKLLGREFHEFRNELKRKCGLIRGGTYFEGTVYADLMSLTELDQAEIVLFLREVEVLVITDYLPGTDIEELWKAIKEYSGARYSGETTS
jgi:hypothetical protein